jgi:hypothetical protein
MDPPDSSEVTQAIRAWRLGHRASKEPVPKMAIGPMGDTVVIEPFQEIRILFWTDVTGEVMALVSWCNALYMVTEDDVEQRTMRVSRSAR